MLPMSANSDQWIADVITYVRNNFGNQANLIEPTDVKRIRAASKDRIGPWTLAELVKYDPPSMDRKKWKLASSHGGDKLGLSVDGNKGSRWDTGATMRPGMWFSIQLPQPTRVLALSLDSAGSIDDYPRGYLVHVSGNGKDWGKPVAKGAGKRGVTTVELSATKPTRFIRITQTGSSNSKYWSIHELAIKGAPAETLTAAKTVALAQLLSKINPSALVKAAKNAGDATRGAKLFYNQTLSCSKCHDPASGKKLGPDLASKRDGVTDAFLVESVLDPTKSIRKGYEQMIVQHEDGLTISGFRVSEDKNTLVIREPAGGKEIKFKKEELLFTRQSKLSAMPAGLVNQLKNQTEFYDLVQFLIEVNAGGPARMKALKKIATGK